MCYWCMPEDSKCEWAKLIDFMKIYNGATKKEFALTKCLDVFERNIPQPEILAEDKVSGEEMVVEHKIVSWPPDHLQKHRAHHLFMDSFAEELRNEFSDDVYVIEVNAKDIEISKRDTLRIVKEIAAIIRANKDFIFKHSGAKGELPIPWVFRRVSEYERDEEDVTEVGVGVTINKDWYFEEFTDQTIAVTERAIQEIIEKHLQQASKKFCTFKKHLRVFVTEAYSSNAHVNNELVEKVISNIKPPENIDEIWVGMPRWISENDYVPTYRRIK